MVNAAVKPIPTPLAPFTGGALIPDALKAQKRWAPWVTKWLPNARGGIGKWDKRPGLGKSTAKPETWLTFEAALAEFNKHPGKYAGLGFVTTGQTEFIGIDLDRCVENGTVAPWALEIVQQLGSYAEISPSRTGLRIMVQGSVPNDWNNHDVGIEVYGGNTSRFLTLTGQHLAGAPQEVRAAPTEVLHALESRYARERAKADVIDISMPEIIDDLLLPSIEKLDLPYKAKDFLLEGKFAGEDRSETLFSTGVALCAAGLDDTEVFSILVHNEHSMALALEKRHDDYDKALAYLWREDVCKARAKVAARRPLTADDFDAITPAPAGAPLRFEFQPAHEFIQRKPLRWLIKRVLPQAALCVLFGPSGSGKTFITLDMVAAIARGVDWRGHKVQQGRVAYICGEGAGGFRNRLVAYARQNEVRLEDIPISILDGAPNFLLAKDIEDVLLGLKRLGQLDVIVVDTLARVMPGGNESSSDDMGRALAHCGVLNKVTGALVVLVTHTGKDVSAGPRGWSGQKGAADVQIEVVRSGDDRAFVIDKMKDGPGEGDEYGFRLVTVPIDIDDDGEEVTSCVVEQTAALPKSERKADISGKFQVTVMRTLEKLASASPEGVFAHDLLDGAVAQFTWDESSGKRDTRRQCCLRALNDLRAANRIDERDGRLIPL